MAKDIVFICGARDFHAMDKYWITAKVVAPRKVHILTDSIESEGQPKLITNDVSVFNLFNIDKLLFKHQSSIGNIWRNLVKAFLIPVQVIKLKRFYKEHPDYIYHAIPMYYMMLCYFSKIPFVATPQGSEILVRPIRSKLYKKYAVKSLRAAKYVVVDSINMRNKVMELSQVEPIILKNGFDTNSLLEGENCTQRNLVISIRGIHPNYRIKEILTARNEASYKTGLTFVYPACELDYKKQFESSFNPEDSILGKLGKPQLYDLMKRTLLAISVPESDSSPRSVYECIFAGACVAVTYSKYIEELPECMKSRLFLVDLKDEGWFDKAIDYAKLITKTDYLPSEEALDMCDQNRTIKKIISKLYN